MKRYYFIYPGAGIAFDFWSNSKSLAQVKKEIKQSLNIKAMKQNKASSYMEAAALVVLCLLMCFADSCG